MQWEDIKKGHAILKGKGVQQYTKGTHRGRLSAVVRYTLARAINPSIAHGMSVLCLALSVGGTWYSEWTFVRVRTRLYSNVY